MGDRGDREMPEYWRKSNVPLTFKKDRKDDPGNYRPDSLTLNPGKLMEQLILRIISRPLKTR